MSAQSGCIHTAALRGVEAVPVDVEVSLSNGIPGITIVGGPDPSVLEARTRVRCALKASGFDMPRMAVTVNLSPGDVRKNGTAFDLPIAVGILVATRQIPREGLDGCLFFGELGLGGEVLGVRGALAYLSLSRECGLSPAGLCRQSDARAFGCEAVSVPHLAQLARGLRALRDAPAREPAWAPEAPSTRRLDFSEVVDQEVPKRACVIAAAGSHGLLMVGPPGAGKTMLARRVPSILPRLGEERRAETALIHSVAGLETASILAGEPPFAAPHHSITVPGLIGGGRPVLPGQVSLAHNGVLFLDELPEFSQSVLQALRQPLEEGVVRLVRADGAYAFPSRFQLVAAANPCPCGHLGDPGHECTCPAAAVAHYQARVGGPIMNRIDLVVDVARPSSERVVAGEAGTSTGQMRAQVQEAREFASWRCTRSQAAGSGASGPGVGEALGLDAAARRLLQTTGSSLRLGGRSLVRIARVARTIADLAQSESVGAEHVAEASMYRSRDTLGG